jgi:hypothetical protein
LGSGRKALEIPVQTLLTEAIDVPGSDSEKVFDFPGSDSKKAFDVLRTLRRLSMFFEF